MSKVKECHKIMLRLTNGLILLRLKDSRLHNPVEIVSLNK